MSKCPKSRKTSWRKGELEEMNYKNWKEGMGRKRTGRREVGIEGLLLRNVVTSARKLRMSRELLPPLCLRNLSSRVELVELAKPHLV